MMSWSGADLITQNQGIRNYELTNHLGNVLSTITDKGVITSAQDYYPFGLTLASRSFTEGGSVYRYSFNGKEDDKGLKQQDYGYRINRPDLGRFLSVDPLTKDYPWYTPYQFAGNKPIWAVDLDGGEEKTVTHFAQSKDGSLYYAGTQVKIDFAKLTSKGKASTHTKLAILNPDGDVSQTFNVGYFEEEPGKGHGTLYPSAMFDYSEDGKDDDDMKFDLDKPYLESGGDHSKKALERDFKAPENLPNMVNGVTILGGYALRMSSRLFKYKSTQTKVGLSNPPKPTTNKSGIQALTKAESSAIKGGTNRLKPEGGYLKGKKHGLSWKEGHARAIKEGKPQGQWGSKADLEFAGQKAHGLEAGASDYFELPAGHSSVVHFSDGTTQSATHIWVRNNGTGTFHGFPVIK